MGERTPWLREAEPAKPTRRTKIISLPLDRAERQFLLVRLGQLGEVADALMAGPGTYEGASLWSRQQVLDRARQIVGFLVEHDTAMSVYGTLSVALLKEAIEGNPYFERMADDDLRFCLAAIQRVEALRLRVQSLLGVPINPVRLGDRRGRSLDVARAARAG